MQRYLIQLSYLGTKYHGWQKQKNKRTIQEEIEKCLSMILRPKFSYTIYGSSRTDTGVHARCQYAHFDYSGELDLGKLVFKMNNILDDDISIREITRVDNNFHSRFDAIRRTYNYYITQTKDPFHINQRLFLRHPIDLNAMSKCCEIMLSSNNFQSFSKVKTQVNNFECKIYDCFWVKDKDEYIFEISSNRFLRGMVRAVVGTMIEVGKGNITPIDFENIISKRDRRFAAKNVSPYGLFLNSVEY